MTSPGEVVHQGWLTKSPPYTRVWKPRWRRRWFALVRSKDAPGQYFLEYYVDKKSQKPKGSINLNLCEQIDAGLRIPRRNSEPNASKGSVFSIKTDTRVYHLEAESVLEMEKWVDVICRVCGLTQYEGKSSFISITRSTEPDTAVSNRPIASGPYIAISDCYTGVPTRDSKGQVFINYVPGVYRVNECGQLRVPRPEAVYKNIQPHDRQMDKLSKNFRWNVTMSSCQRSDYKNLTSLSLSDMPGTPAPPRPPKPSHLVPDHTHKETFVGPKVHEPNENVTNSNHAAAGAVEASQLSHVSYANTAQLYNKKSPKPEQLYYMYTAPPVDRELKPGRSRGRSSSYCYESHDIRSRSSRSQPVKLQYLDLDLVPPSSDSPVSLLRSRSTQETSTVYKTVDFLKTQALNMTRIEAEAFHRNDIQLQH